MKEFTLKIISPDSVVFEGKCVSLIFDAPDGKYGIQAYHAPLISAVSPGEITITSREGTSTLTVPGGIIRAEGNETVMLI